MFHQRHCRLLTFLSHLSIPDVNINRVTVVISTQQSNRAKINQTKTNATVTCIPKILYSGLNVPSRQAYLWGGGAYIFHGRGGGGGPYSIVGFWTD